MKNLLIGLLMLSVLVGLLLLPQIGKTENAITLGGVTMTPIDAEAVNADILTSRELQSIQELRLYASTFRLLNQDIAEEENWDCDDWARNFATQAMLDGVEIGLAMPIVWVDGDLVISHLTTFGIVGNRVYCVEPQAGVVCNWNGWIITVD